MSTQNILDLVTQMNNLETNISSIVMEFASKLTALTDLHLLLVLENRDGRQLCGSRHLLEDYARGGLGPLGNDVVVDLETETRYNVTDLAPVEQEIFQPEVNFDLSSLAVEKNDAVDVKPRLKRKLNGGVDVESKRRRGESPRCVVNVREEDSDRTPRRWSQNKLNCHAFALGSLSEDDHPFVSDVDALNLPSVKMEYLKNVQNPLPLFEKGTVEYRLFNSLLYDFGKEVAYASPYPLDGPEAKLFFFKSLDHFIDLFPCLKSQLLKDVKIRTKTPMAIMRMNARAGFQRVQIQRRKHTGH